VDRNSEGVILPVSIATIVWELWCWESVGKLVAPRDLNPSAVADWFRRRRTFPRSKISAFRDILENDFVKAWYVKGEGKEKNRGDNKSQEEEVCLVGVETKRGDDEMKGG